MGGVVLRTVVALATGLTVAAAAAASGHSPAGAARVTPFGGSTGVRVEHAGHIEVDLAPASSQGLRRIRCSAPAAETTACFVGR